MEYYDFHLKFEVKKSDAFDYSGGCVVKEYLNWKEYKTEETGKEFVKGILIKTENNKDLEKKLKQFQNAEYLCLEAENYEIIRTAIKRTAIDCIIGTSKNEGIDYIIAKECAQKKIAIDISFSELLNSENRSKTLRNMKETVTLSRKYGTPVTLTSGAKDEWKLMPKDNLFAFGQFIGFTKEEAEKAMNYVPEKILKRKEKGYYAVKGAEIL